MGREGHEARWAGMAVRERELWRAGLKVAGIDEVGRGPLAGPVVACAVILPPDALILGVDDSKRVSRTERERLYPVICRTALAIGVGAVGPRQIDRVNIYQATRLAMRQAFNDVEQQADWVLVDAMALELPCPAEGLIGGDGRSVSIAAASIVAKVIRDRYMDLLDAEFPGYGFARHKGYASPEHWAALDTLGPCAAHRQSFLQKYYERREA